MSGADRRTTQGNCHREIAERRIRLAQTLQAAQTDPPEVLLGHRVT